MRPDFSEIDRHTPAAVAQGIRLMQSHMFRETDALHVDYLMEFADLPFRAVVADMGCGIGEFARLASVYRPDIDWALINLSQAQLDLCPEGERFAKSKVDACNTHFADGYFDAVIFQTALVQMDRPRALREAARILKPGGTLMLSEMVRVGGDNTWWREHLQGEVPTLDELYVEVRQAGFVLDELRTPTGDDSKFRALLGDDAHQLDHVAPTLWSASKE